MEATKTLILEIWWNTRTGREMQQAFQWIRAFYGEVLATKTAANNGSARLLVRVPWEHQWRIGCLHGCMNVYEPTPAMLKDMGVTNETAGVL